MKFVLVCAAGAAALLGGCAYNVPVTATPNLNVYSSFGEKLHGKYALTIVGENFSTTVKPTGYQCSFHSFPIDIRDTFKQSAVKTMEQLVDAVDVVSTPLSTAELERGHYDGQVIIQADSISAHVQFIPGFLEPTADANVTLAANMTVDGVGGRMLGTMGEGAGNSQSGGGVYCGGGANAIGTATEKALKNLMGQLGERFSNAPKLRKAG